MKPTGSFKVFKITRIHNFLIPISLFFERTDPEIFLKLELGSSLKIQITAQL
jgi:hypothetical protein